MVSEEMKAFCHQMMDYRLPRWSELPGFDIYMDQLITLVRQYLAPLFDEEDAIITSSMINNYVKAGLIPKPEKKRYHAQHIASLIAITLLKQVQQYLSDFHADHLAVRLVTLSFASALSAKKMMALRKGLPETEEQ